METANTFQLLRLIRRKKNSNLFAASFPNFADFIRYSPQHNIYPLWYKRGKYKSAKCRSESKTGGENILLKVFSIFDDKWMLLTILCFYVKTINKWVHLMFDRTTHCRADC